MDSLRLQLQGLRCSSQELKLSLLGSGQSLSAHAFWACERLLDILRHGRGSLQLQGLRRSSQELKLSLLGSGQSLSAHVFGACERLLDILRHGRGSLLVSICIGPEHFAKSYLCHAFLQLTSVSLVHVVSSVCRLLLELAGLHVLTKSGFDVFCSFVVKHAESCPTLATLYQRFEVNPMHGQFNSIYVNLPPFQPHSVRTRGKTLGFGGETWLLSCVL